MNRKPDISSWQNKNHGFTLIELMIAMVLGIILLGGVIGIFLANQETSRINSQLSQLQTSARVSFQLLSRDLRSASFSGCGNNPNVVNVTTAFNAAAAPWATWNGGVLGYDTALPQIAGMTPFTGTDAIRLMYGTGDGVTVSGHDVASSTFTVNLSPAANGFVVGELALVCDASAKAALFEITNIANAVPFQVRHLQGAASNASGFLGLPLGSPTTFGLGAMVMPLESVAWFVAENQNNGKSLYRSIVVNGAEQADEIIDGVDNLQFEYEVLQGTAPPGVWMSANNVPATSWGLVISVRVVLTMENGTQMSDNLNTMNHMVANRNRMQ